MTGNHSVYLQPHVVLPDGIAENATIRCEAGRILHVGEPVDPHSSDEIFDYRGHYISPGFVNIHGAAGADYMDGTMAAARAVNVAHARHGTTSIFPTTTTDSFKQLDDMVKACGNVQASRAPLDGAPVLAFIYMAHIWRLKCLQLIESERGSL
jgi:N-acetylglucosamine-6-phosphate deacetylase